MIDMSYNVLTTLTNNERIAAESQSKKLGRFTIYLSGNAFSCSCLSLEFIEWLFKTDVTFDNYKEYRCLLDNGTLTTTRRVWQDIVAVKRNCVSRWWLAFAISGFMLLSVGLLVTGFAYRFRWSLKYWYFRIRRKVQYQELAGDDRVYKYQAFVAYNHLDYKWACGPLLNNLEREDLKLCLHHRDFPVGEFICDNIVDAINNSRKVLFVVTQNFIKSDWGEFELKMASIRMFQEDRNSIVVVFLDDIPARQMPKSLLDIWQRITCLEWTEDRVGQDTFWNKLREAVET